MRILKFVRENIITILTIVSVFAGVAVGIALKQAKPQWTEREVKYVEFPGELFLRMLKSLIIPLLTASIICAVGTLDLSLSKKIALRSIGYYGITTVMAVILGIILVITIRPGENIKNKDFVATETNTKPVLTQDTLLDLISLSPIGVFFLVTAKVVGAAHLGVLVERLGMYFVTVLLGLSIHGFCTLSVLFFLATRRLPFKTLGQLAPVLVTAFGTASSSATMPLTIQTLDSIGVDPRVTRFVIPVGATINMDGTALYEAVAALFIAQFRGKNFNFGNLVAVSVTATFASIGAAGIPQAGLVTMVMVLDTLGLPSQDVSLILAVDWLLDRFRTTINVIGDSLGAVIVGHLSKEELKDLPLEDKMNADPHELTELTKGHITQV
ncbi:sodium/dicarboxylate symporter-related [Holotrichia oblita]|uniref:Sodium/dicarboxylate symporter-related n=1 Tax=Holotrichia oblita TaxID=644536 RepID=A0ACB9TKJ2_HOLOL|nr:sodium/dicarboxylate symporter-related [Holotrichia oblita]